MNQTIPHPLTEELKLARGDRFVAVRQQVYQECSPALVVRANEIIAQNGKLTTLHVAQLAVEFNLQLKHAFEFLEWQGILPSGTYERLRDRGLKVGEVMEKVKAL